MKKNYTTYILLGILLAISGFLIFKNLSNIYLWQDEAESAVLAKNILKFGYPSAIDGTNSLKIYLSSLGANHQWKFHPWLHFYFISLSYLALGISTFSSRLPFAICGIFSILLAFFLARKLFKKDGIALLSVLFTATSVPFILHIRQCRYYGLQTILVLAIMLAYLKTLEKKSKHNWLILGILLTALYYTNNGAFVPIFGTLFIHIFFLANKEKSIRRNFIIMCACVIMAALPWALYSSISAQYLAKLDLATLKKNFGFQIRVLNKYIFPVFFFTALYIFRSIKKKSWKIALDKDDRPALGLILLLICANILFYTIVEQRTIRYYVHLFPFLYMLQAWILVNFLSKRKAVCAILIIFLIFTNIFHNSLPYIFKKKFFKETDFYLVKYIYEITHDYDGPLEGTVLFLKDHAKPGDKVKVAYDDSSLIFYLPYLKIENDHFFNNKDFPKWIVWRDYWINEYKGYVREYAHQWKSGYDEDYVREIKSRYIAHEIPYPDIIWENRPDDMEYHKFKTSDEPRKVIIYERKGS